MGSEGLLRLLWGMAQGKLKPPPDLSEKTDLDALRAFAKEAQVNGYEGAEGEWKVFLKKYQVQFPPPNAQTVLKYLLLLLEGPSLLPPMGSV